MTEFIAMIIAIQARVSLEHWDYAALCFSLFPSIFFYLNKCIFYWLLSQSKSVSHYFHPQSESSGNLCLIWHSFLSPSLFFCWVVLAFFLHALVFYKFGVFMCLWLFCLDRIIFFLNSAFSVCIFCFSALVCIISFDLL